ncbi:MAG: glycosyltransferase family 39 protein [Verrucomicrobia bacterium]|nr:glycosyltransferase family 39 protein [Verrucomicrobiota bacterium]
MTNNRATLRYLIALLAAGGLLLFVGAGSKGFWPSSEDRTAELVREMIVTGDYLVPHLCGNPLVTKPPLLHWTIVSSTWVFGLNEFGVRFSSLCFALGTALVLFLVGRKFLHERAAFLAAIVLLTAPVLLHSHWRTAKIDVLLTLLVTAALLTFFAAIGPAGIGPARRGRGQFALFFVLVGLAGMAKGPAGMGPPLLVVSIYLATTRQWRRLARVPWLWGVPVMVVLGLWWYGALLVRFGGWAGLRHVMDAETSVYFGWQHEEAGAILGYYLARILGDFFPWSLLLPAAVVLAVRMVRRHENRFIAFVLAWLAVYFVLFSLISKKAGRYMLPFYPAAALLVGQMCHAAIRRALSPGLWRWSHGGVIAAALVCLGVVVVVVTLASDFDYESWYVTDRWTVAKDRLMLEEITGVLRGHRAVTLVVAGALSGLFAAGAALWRRRTALAFGLIAAAAAGIAVGYQMGLVPALDRTFSPRHFARHLRELVPEDAPLAGYCEHSGQVDDCTHFYLGRAVDVLLTRKALREWATMPPPRYVFMLDVDAAPKGSGVIYEWFEPVDTNATYRGHTVLLFRNRPEHSTSADPE